MVINYEEGIKETGKLYHETYKETSTKIKQVFIEFTEEEYAQYEQDRQKGKG